MITIKFNNPNSRTLTSIDLYREPVGTEIPDVPVNPPIVTLDGFATVYVDHDTVLGQDYNYRFRVYKQGGESVMSPNMVFGDVSLYGPGPYYEAKSGSDTIWDFGEVTAIEDLPSITELALIAGPSCEFLGWNGKWRKFKIGSDIYYTPSRSLIHIRTEEFEGFMSRAYSGRLIDRDYSSYEFITALSPVHAMAYLDGRVPTTWSMDKEYPRQDALEPYVGKSPTANLVYSINSESNGQTLVQRPAPYMACSSSYVYMTTHQSFEWYWKPIIRFIPKTERNYP